MDKKIGIRCLKILKINEFWKAEYLDRLDEGVEQDPDAHRAAQQLYQACRAKKPKEADIHNPRCIDDAPHHRDEVECVPRVFKVGLKIGKAWTGEKIRLFFY